MNLFIITKVFITALIITAITELSKKSVSIGGLFAAMPILTIIALFWFYYEKKDNIFLAGFTKAVLAGFPMTIMFFLPTIYLFKKGYNFYFVIFVGILFLAIGAYIQQKIMGR
jgi:hypothetical protein